MENKKFTQQEIKYAEQNATPGTKLSETDLNIARLQIAAQTAGRRPFNSGEVLKIKTKEGLLDRLLKHWT